MLGRVRHDPAVVVGHLEDGAVVGHETGVVGERAVAHLADLQPPDVVGVQPLCRLQGIGSMEVPFVQRRHVPDADAVTDGVVLLGLVADVIVQYQPPSSMNVAPMARWASKNADLFDVAFEDLLMRRTLAERPFRNQVAVLFAALARAARALRSARISRAAFAPGPPVMPPPGCAPEPHRYRPRSGIRYRACPINGRHAKN